MITLVTVDYAEAIEKAGGNNNLAKELFGMLLHELPTLRDKLAQAIDQEDHQAMWDHAHKLYGSIAYCGVPRLREAASTMENAVKAKALTPIREQFTHLNAAILDLLQQGPSLLTATW